MHTFKYFTISSEKKQQSLPPAIKWSILICIKFYGEDFYETTKYIRYILLPTTLLCLIASLFCGCSANSGKISKTGFYFDTMITVTLYGTRDEKILDDCFSLAGNYEKKLSNTITDSEVSKINQANGQFVTVSSDTLSLIKDGIRYGKISDGTFDITIGTLSDLWNFSEIAETAKSDENEVDASVVPSPEKN